MEIDDETAVWRKYNARLDELVQTNALLLRRSSLVVTQTVLDRLRRTLWFGILIDAIVVLLLGQASVLWPALKAASIPPALATRAA